MTHKRPPWEETIGSREGDGMEINIRDDAKIVEIWLDRQEKADMALRSRLEPLYQAYHARRYLVAVFLSGTAPLYEETRDLLLYGRRRQAELEVRQEKGDGAACPPP